MSILKRIVAIIITAVILYTVFAIIFSLPYSVAPYMLIGWGLILLIISVLSNIHKNSPRKLGVANRYEFYSVTVVLVGLIVGINLRVDSIFQILLTMK